MKSRRETKIRLIAGTAVAPPEVRQASKRSRTQGSFMATLCHSLVWLKEMPGILRGLLELAQAFRRQMAILLTMNVMVIGADALVPLVTAPMLTMLSPYEIKQSLWVVALEAVLIPIVFNRVAELLLPLVRDLYGNRHLWPQLEMAIAIRSLPSIGVVRRITETTSDTKDKNTAQMASKARAAAAEVLCILLRDPAYIVRGFVLLLCLGYVSWPIALLLVCGLSVEFFIASRMNQKCAPLIEDFAKTQSTLLAAETEVHKPVGAIALSPREQLAQRTKRSEFVKATKPYIGAWSTTETLKLVYQGFRALQASATYLIIAMLLAYLRYVQVLTFTEFVVLIQLVLRATEVMTVFLGIQKAVMSNREYLKWLGDLTQVNFGLKSAK